MPVARDDKYHMSSERPDLGSLGPQRYFNSRADGRVIARTLLDTHSRPFKASLVLRQLQVRVSRDHVENFCDLCKAI